jgi:hypothetical protein
MHPGREPESIDHAAPDPIRDVRHHHGAALHGDRRKGDAHPTREEFVSSQRRWREFHESGHRPHYTLVCAFSPGRWRDVPIEADLTLFT